MANLLCFVNMNYLHAQHLLLLEMTAPKFIFLVSA